MSESIDTFTGAPCAAGAARRVHGRARRRWSPADGRWVRLAAASASAAASADKSANKTALPSASTVASDVLNKYCVTCHNGRLKTAGLLIDSLDLDTSPDQAQQWEKVVTKLRTGEMPPPGRPRPDAATYSAVAASLETRARCARPRRTRIPAACRCIA